MFTYNELVTMVSEVAMVEERKYVLNGVRGEYGQGKITVWGTEERDENSLKMTLLHELGHMVYQEWGNKRPEVEKAKGWAEARGYKKSEWKEEEWAQGFAEWALENKEELIKVIKGRPKIYASEMKYGAIIIAGILAIVGMLGYQAVYGDGIQWDDNTVITIPIK